MLLDIHSHSIAHNNVVTVRSFTESFETIPGNIIFSAGLHPWFIHSDTALQQLSELENLLYNEKMAAIGECGLDKACTTDFDLQKEMFKAQIKFAKSFQKPLIIHCVRAFDEVIHLLEQEAFKLPILFHGFNKSIELAKRLVSKNYFLSFGRDLLKPRIAAVFQAVSADKFLLETDNADISIEEIFNAAAGLRNLTLSELEKQVFENAKIFFSNNSSLLEKLLK